MFQAEEEENYCHLKITIVDVYQVHAWPDLTKRDHQSWVHSVSHVLGKDWKTDGFQLLRGNGRKMQARIGWYLKRSGFYDSNQPRMPFAKYGA